MLHALRSAARPSAPMLRCSTPLRSSCVDILRSDAPMLGRNCSAYLFCAAAQQRTGASATYNSAAPQQRSSAPAQVQPITTAQRRSSAAAHWRKRSLTTAQRRSSAQAQGNNSAAAQRNLTTAQRRSSRESIARTYRLERRSGAAAQRRSGAKQFKAAGEAVIALKDQQAARTGLNDGFKEASKVIRQPEPFGSEVHEEDLGRWQDFNVNFRAWLFYGNKHFEGDLHRIESVHGDIPIPSVDGEAPEVQALQQHVQLQMTETSSYDQVRTMVISYERTTTSWSAGKIHSELGILSSDSKKVNQVESQTTTSAATSSSGGGPSISPPSTAAVMGVPPTPDEHADDDVGPELPAQQFLQAVLQMFLFMEHMYTKEMMQTKVVTAGHPNNRELDELESYDYGLDDVEDDSDEPQLSFPTLSDDVLKLLTGECSKLSIDTTLYKTSMPHGLDPQTIQLMHDTNAVLRARYDRLEALYEEAESG
ncbi:unnamed protein product [Cladocopium goreaui]|uniref:Uncharacterized protein n=1 Tax=Cladocopium goreaui TaxID=2562237 RepID=A0A9P1CA09_9DINO|nr:unnamed protein product [Cladocopium goreaui]